MDRSVPRLALYGLAVLVLGVVLVAGATSTSAFATHNPAWDGTADFRGIAAEESSFEIVRNVSAYGGEQANGTLAIVLSPSVPYGGTPRAFGSSLRAAALSWSRRIIGPTLTRSSRRSVRALASTAGRSATSATTNVRRRSPK